MHRWQNSAIEKIGNRVRIEEGKLLEAGLGLDGSLAGVSNDLLNLRNRAANFGRGQVNSELIRQEKK